MVVDMIVVAVMVVVVVVIVMVVVVIVIVIELVAVVFVVLIVVVIGCACVGNFGVHMSTCVFPGVPLSCLGWGLGGSGLGGGAGRAHIGFHWYGKHRCRPRVRSFNVMSNPAKQPNKVTLLGFQPARTGCALAGNCNWMAGDVGS
jgi:hypothetical protein